MNSSIDTYTIKVVNDSNFVRELGFCVAEIYLASCNLRVLHLLNQMSRDLGIFISDKAKAPTGPIERITNNLGFLDLAPLLEVARKIFVTKLIIQPSDKDLLLDTTNRLILTFNSFLDVSVSGRSIS